MLDLKKSNRDLRQDLEELKKKVQAVTAIPKTNAPAAKPKVRSPKE